MVRNILSSTPDIPSTFIFDTFDESITFVATYDGCNLDAEIVRDVPKPIMDQYKFIVAAQKEEARRKAEMKRKEDYELLITNWCNEFGIAERDILEGLYKNLGDVNFAKYCKLVNSFLEGKLRSDFKKSLARQIFEWMHDAEKRSKFPKPLSPRQHDIAVSEYNHRRY